MKIAMEIFLIIVVCVHEFALKPIWFSVFFSLPFIYVFEENRVSGCAIFFYIVDIVCVYCIAIKYFWLVSLSKICSGCLTIKRVSAASEQEKEAKVLPIYLIYRKFVNTNPKNVLMLIGRKKVVCISAECNLCYGYTMGFSFVWKCAEMHSIPAKYVDMTT